MGRSGKQLPMIISSEEKVEESVHFCYSNYFLRIYFVTSLNFISSSLFDIVSCCYSLELKLKLPTDQKLYLLTVSTNTQAGLL